MALACSAPPWKLTKKIWKTYLQKPLSSDLVEVDEEEIIEYARAFLDYQSTQGSAIGPVWNGRQIRPAQPQSQFPVSQGGLRQQSVKQPQQLHQLQQQSQRQQLQRQQYLGTDNNTNSNND
ncbi:hypothetical protein GGR53DRAFT_37052 [Hypoxylon sp. FL1150]|nr:hypothetical protein GGR53DRAFT_37052 [Hypoxylon sp. FL1150]